ncbi:hypothetical protein RCL1_003356 [Eukaryota sp. TZLM3-RCL]
MPNLNSSLKLAASLWEQGRLPTLDFLMIANICAGRSHDDISQYPVLPWLFSDYSSSSLSLSSINHYRDLTKPMGAQSPSRAAVFQERYDSWGDTSLPKFHYGSLYSNPGVVINWLIRMEPFSTALVRLQSGYFDAPDRLTHSLSDAWRSAALGGPSDVKEMVPEMYTNPESFVNNFLVLGRRHDGILIDDLLLPSWSRTSIGALTFCHTQRKALEHNASLVSEWIDLIFGKKQQGPLAHSSLNVFHHLAYPSSLSLVHRMQDGVGKSAAKHQVFCFGSIPRQLWPEGSPSVKNSRGVPRVLGCWIFTPSILKVKLLSTTSDAVNIDFSTGSPTVVPFNVFAISSSSNFVYMNYLNRGWITCSLGKNNPQTQTQNVSKFVLPSTITFATALDGLFYVGTSLGIGHLFSSQQGSSCPVLLIKYLRIHTHRIISAALSPCDNLLVSLDSSGTFAVWELSDGSSICRGTVKDLISVDFCLVEGTLGVVLCSRHSVTVVSPFKGLAQVYASTSKTSLLPSISCCCRPIPKLSLLDKFEVGTGSVMLVTGHVDGNIRLWTYRFLNNDVVIVPLAKLSLSDSSSSITSIWSHLSGIVVSTPNGCYYWTNEVSRKIIDEDSARVGSSNPSGCKNCGKKFGLIGKSLICESCDAFVCGNCVDHFQVVEEGKMVSTRICFPCAFTIYSKLLC